MWAFKYFCLCLHVMEPWAQQLQVEKECKKLTQCCIRLEREDYIFDRGSSFLFSCFKLTGREDCVWPITSKMQRKSPIWSHIPVKLICSLKNNILLRKHFPCFFCSSQFLYYELLNMFNFPTSLIFSLSSFLFFFSPPSFFDN